MSVFKYLIKFLFEDSNFKFHIKNLGKIVLFVFHLNLRRVLENRLQWRNFYYRTYYGPILHFLVTFYFIYIIKCDLKVEYGTIKSSIVKIFSPYGQT